MDGHASKASQSGLDRLESGVERVAPAAELSHELAHWASSKPLELAVAVGVTDGEAGAKCITRIPWLLRSSG